MTTEPHRGPLADLAALVAEGDLAAEAKPFGPDPAKDRKRQEIADMVLPPAHLVDQLDNSGAATAAEPDEAEEEVTLDFFGDDLPVFTRRLRHPFTWQGIRVEAVEVRQFTTLEAGRLSAELGRKGAPDFNTYDIYARMVRVLGTETLLPAAVLRKLPAVDGFPIVDAAYGFLPPSFRAEAG